MKNRIIYAALLALCTMCVQAQSENEFWRTTINSSGLYGAYDEEGECRIPNVFQQMGFWGTSSVTFVRYDDKYYLIDRQGEIVGGDSWELQPQVYDRFACVGNEGNVCFIDFQGNQLTPEASEAGVVKLWPWLKDGLLLWLGRSDGTRMLRGIDGTVVVETCADYEPLATVPLVRYTKNGLTGVSNMTGNSLLAPEYTSVEEVNLGQWNKADELMRKSKVARLYSRDELEATTLLFARTEGGNVVVFDASGRPVGPIYTDEGTERVLRKLMGNTLPTYLMNRESNLGGVRTLTDGARDDFERRQQALLSSLPTETTGGFSLLSLTQEKNTQLNALRRNDITASNDELSVRKEQIDDEFSLNKKPRAAARREEQAKASEVTLPEAGQLPQQFELCYASTDQQRAILINGSKSGDSYIFSSSSNGGNTVTVTIGAPIDDADGWRFDDDGSRRSVVIARDWSQVSLRQGRTSLVYGKPITQHEYEIIKKAEAKK